jgi:hypothetical protein
MQEKPTPSAQRADLLSWMDDAHRRLVKSLPDKTPASVVTLLQGSLLAECMGHFLAVRSLLEERLVSQALILDRSLVEASILLAYLATNKTKADELALRYWWRSTNREHELVLEAERVHGVDLANRRRVLREDMAAIEQEATRLGIAEFRKKIPSTADMAAAVGASTDVVSHGVDLLSLHVHSGRTPLSRRVVPQAQTAGSFTPREDDPEWHIHASQIATVALVDATAAVAVLQEWDSSDEVLALSNEVGLGFPRT